MSGIAAVHNSLEEPFVTLDTPTYLPPPGPPPLPNPSDTSITSASYYAPPPGPPPGTPKLVDFPFLSSEQFQTLYSRGYTRVHLTPDHALLKAVATLFSASRDFFDRTSEEKQQFSHSNFPSDPFVSGSRSKKQSSEEGWARVQGEKELLTIRRVGPLCPPELTDHVRNFWKECGDFMQAIIRSIEASLGLGSGAFDNVVREECLLPVDEVHETLLRMFRYERASEPRIVSEKHCDLGILSLVIGSSPGLEVWDNTITETESGVVAQSKGGWVSIEEDGSNEMKQTGGLTLTLLIGESLTALSNGLYKPGIHRVSVPPSDSTNDAKYRYSTVFALRPNRQAILYTPSLTTAVTRPFKWPSLDENGVIPTVKAVDLFNTISSRHWSVNDTVEERETRKIKLKERSRWRSTPTTQS